VFLGGFGVVTLLFGLVLAPIKVEVDLNLLRVGDPMPDLLM
jgi:hypothetical protein